MQHAPDEDFEDADDFAGEDDNIPAPSTSNALTISQLRSLKPSSPIWVINTSDNVSSHKGDVFISIRQADGKTDVIEIPNSWLPIDLTKMAPQKAILNSSHFLDAINSDTIMPVTNEYAEELLGRESAKTEKHRLKAQSEAVRAATQANQIGKNVTISTGDDDEDNEHQALLDKVNGRSRRAISVTDIDAPNLDLFPKVSPPFKSWVTKNNELTEASAINDLKVRGKLSAEEADYYVQTTKHDRIKTFLKSRMS